MAEVNINVSNGLSCKVSPSSMAVISLFTLCSIGLTIVHNQGTPITFADTRLMIKSNKSQTGLGNNRPVNKTTTHNRVNIDDFINNTQLSRKRLLQSICQKTPVSKSSSVELNSLRNSFKHLLVDDRHKLMYCYVPKTGCTGWKSTLMRLNAEKGKAKGYVHSVKVLKKYGIRELSSYKPEEITLRLQTYYKFMFVRHPLIRIVSAFRDKFTGKADIYFVHVPKMLNYTRNLNKSIKVKDVPKYNFTFTEFLNYTYDSKDQSTRRDEHWNNFDRLCSPCYINYNFIGKQETFDKDTKYILNTVLKSNTSKLATPNWTGTTDAIARKFFNSVPEKLRRKVIKNFERDAEMFGYDISKY